MPDPGKAEPSVVTPGAGGTVRRPVVDARWLRDASLANRLAFEREMRRVRRRLDTRFESFWKRAAAARD